MAGFDARDEFVQIIRTMGGHVLGKYSGVNTPVECVCSQGHRCYPRHHSVRQGRGMCQVCAGREFETAKEAFFQRIEALGGKVIGEYKNVDTPVDCLCRAGHPWRVKPRTMRHGIHACRICGHSDRESDTFSKRIEELGGKVVGEYKDSTTLVDCICSKGHPCRVIPGNIQDQHYEMCPVCFYPRGIEYTGNDSLYPRTLRK